MVSMYCMVRNRTSFSSQLSYHLVCLLRELYFLCLLYLLSANLFALAARCRKRTMPSLPQANTVPVKNKIFDDELSEGEELPSCQGKSLSLPSAQSGPQKQLDTKQLLDAMRNLFLHLEGITEEWNEWMKSPPGMPSTQLKRMQVTLQAQAPAILCCWLNKHPKHTINCKNLSQLPSMVGFFRVLSSLSVLRPNHREGMLCTFSGNLIPIARPPCKHPVDSFNFWWQVWTKYEMEIVPFSHKRNHKRRRAVHRSPQLTAHWQSTHGNCRSGSPPQARKTATFINESCVTSKGLQASSHVQSLSGVPPPGQLPTFYRKSSHRLTCRPGTNVYEHTQTLIL